MHGTQRCAIVGRVSMDLTNLDISECAAAPGDWVEFLGPRLPVDTVAGWAETIAYEILTGLGRRPARSYSG
jgi:alanine racemase